MFLSIFYKNVSQTVLEIMHCESRMKMQSNQNWSTITLIMHIRVYCIRISLTLKLLLYLGSIEVQVEVFVSTAASLRSRFPTPSDCEGCCCYLGGSLVFKVTRSCHLLWNYPKNTGFSFFFAEGKTVKRLLHSVQLTIISLYRNWIYRIKPQKTWNSDWPLNSKYIHRKFTL